MDLRFRNPIRQACDLQRMLVADAENPNTTPAQRASLAKAWCELEERKRILRGKGLPKAIEPTRQSVKGLRDGPLE